jgi:hypothetical protein
MECFSQVMFAFTLICFVVDISYGNFNLVHSFGNKEYANKIRSHYEKINVTRSVSFPVITQKKRGVEDLEKILDYEKLISDIQPYDFPSNIKRRYKRNLSHIKKV